MQAIAASNMDVPFSDDMMYGSKMRERIKLPITADKQVYRRVT
jgi:hypothetical protein